MEDKKLYLIDDDLYDDEIIEQLMKTGKDKELSVSFTEYTAGVAYLNSGEYLSYSTNERAAFAGYEKHPTFKEAVIAAREKLEALHFELNYVEKSIERRRQGK